MTLDERIAEAELQVRAAHLAWLTVASASCALYPTIRDELFKDKVRARGMLDALREIKETSEKPPAG